MTMKPAYFFLGLLCIGSFSFSYQYSAPRGSERFLTSRSVIDSLPFISDSSEGWRCLYSYITAVNSDSLELEVVLSVRKIDSVKWTTDLPFGRLRSDFRPQVDQIIDFHDNSPVKRVVILANQNCLIALRRRYRVPTDGATVVPLKIRYKKS